MAKEDHLLELELRGFRGFDHVHLKKFRDVNVIVGENNAGKTSLLEAIAMGANTMGSRNLVLKSLRLPASDSVQNWLINDGAEDKAFHIEIKTQRGAFGMSRGSEEDYENYADRVELKVAIISSHVGAQPDLIKNFGEAVRSRKGEDLIHKILQQLDQRISRVRVDPLPSGNIITLDIGLSESIPLSQAGQGIYRVVAILSKLVGEKPDICLIDEIENGLHHTVHKKVWEGLAKISKELEIQLFVSTHSDECLEAAFEVFDATEEDDFAVIQCMRIGDRIESRVLGEKEIKAAFRNELELR